MAIRSALIAWSVLMFFALLGEPLLRSLGIQLASFRIAGGIMLFAIALDMVFEKRTERREERAANVEQEDVSVFPMAIPMIAGPGSIASAMLLTARAEGVVESVLVLGAMTLVILLTMLSLLAAGPLMRFIGARLTSCAVRPAAPGPGRWSAALHRSRRWRPLPCG
jgi:multiple antibiotic resistance protein